MALTDKVKILINNCMCGLTNNDPIKNIVGALPL